VQSSYFKTRMPRARAAAARASTSDAARGPAYPESVCHLGRREFNFNHRRVVLVNAFVITSCLRAGRPKRRYSGPPSLSAMAAFVEETGSDAHPLWQ